MKETVIDYTRRLATLLGLGHWRIDQSAETAGEDAYASIHVTAGQQRAALRLGSSYTTQSPEDQRSTILHELIHIWLWPCGEAVEHAQGPLGAAAFAVLDAAHDLAVERATDGIAVAIAPLFPLPGK